MVFTPVVSESDSKPQLEELSAFDTKDQIVTKLQYSAAAKLVAGVIDDSTVLYTFENGKPVLKEHSRSKTDFTEGNPCQNALAFDCTGKLLATGGDDGVVRIWKVDSSAGTYELSLSSKCVGHEQPITDLNWNSQGSMLVTASRDSRCRVWSKAGKELYILPEARDANLITGLTLDKRSARSKYIFKGCRFYQENGQDRIVTLQAAVSRGSTYLTEWAVVTKKKKEGEDQTACEPLRALCLCEEPAGAISISLDNEHIGVGTTAGQVVILSSRSLKIVKKKEGIFGLPVTAMTFAPSKREENESKNAPDCLLSVSADYQVYLMSVTGPSSMIMIIVAFLLLVAVVYMML